MTSQKTSNLLGIGLLGAGLWLLFVGERVLGFGVGRALVSGLGALAVLSACALRVLAYVRASGDVRGVEGGILAGYAAVLCALILYACSVEPVLSWLSPSDEARASAVPVLTVLWLVVLSVALSAIVFMELVYARMPIAASVELRRVRTAAYAGLTLALSSVFLLCMNYVATARDVRRDLSYFRTTAPSEATLRSLDKLQTPLRVVLFWRDTDDVLQQIKPYFSALAAHTPKVEVEVLDSVFVPELVRKHRVHGNGSVLLLSGEGDKQKGQSINIGNELTEARSQLRKLDGLFQQSFAKLARPERSVALSVGHGERNAKTRENTAAAGESARILEEIWRRLNIKTSKFGAAEGLSEVPTGTGAVVVVGPEQKFLPEEVDTLINYVRHGGRVLLMLDKISPPDVDDGLTPLLAALGIARQPGTVASERTHLRRAHDASDRTLVFSNKFSSHASVSTATRFQQEVASIFVGAVGLTRVDDASLTPKPSVTFPLRSGPDFFRDLDGDFTHDANEPEEAINLIAAITLPGQNGGQEGRAVIIGDGDFMTDKVSSNNGNVMVFVDSLAWLIGNEELSAQVSSEEDVPIQHSRDQDKLWFYATTFAVPLPLLGVAAWVSRRRRRPAEGA